MRALIALAIVTLPQSAGASPDWSSRPRWSLPSVARDDCPGTRPDRRRVLRRASSLQCPPEPSAAGEGGGASDRAAPPAPRPHRVGSPSRLLPPWAVTGREIALHPRVEPTRRADPRPPPPGSPPLDAGQVMALSFGQCTALLDEAGADYTRADAPQVEQPIRPTRLGGVDFVIPWSRDLGSDHHAIWDCRLAVALLPMGRWLARHGVREVHYFSSLRRGAITRRKPRSQHNVGLAIDILGLVSNDFADRVDVQTHYPRGRVGQCPPQRLSAAGWTAQGRLLANFVCAAYDWRLVHTLLTPDHDRAHDNHLHLDVKPGQRRPVDPYMSFSDPGAR